MLAKITSDSCRLGFSGILFLHFQKIPNFEAFTFVNRKSALHLCMLHEYFKLLASAILYIIYCIYVCGIYWKDSYNSESWKSDVNENKAAYWLGKLLLQNNHVGENFHPFPYMYSLRINHALFVFLFFLLSLQRCVMDELEVCTFWLIEKAFLFFFLFTSSLCDYLDRTTSSINLKTYIPSAHIK